MFVIGLTGGIGTGKTQVSEMLEKLGAAIVNADLLGHQVYLPQSEGWREVVDTFGQEILTPEGEIDRRKLGPIVFGDPEALNKLNAITHPKIHGLAEDSLRRLAEQGREVAVLEAALLIEAKWTGLVDEVWVTTAPVQDVVRRIQERNGLDEEAIRSRISSQMPQEERVTHADVIVENAGDLIELGNKIQELWDRRVATHKESRRKR
ncbi:MAG: dephospho-CoA kinase [SAR202 cluster bacterium Casp-Chloro-G4]|nr:dephospho-CoA kinase [Chloroflexota bacterium]MDA1227753.1 dephospho-CoA kinase [Chloroflexota bacterium]PKB61554.1 MAG: dephospho-CoA kinase [SAR202 cluster bacterium Casp-Chloro-G4]